MTADQYTELIEFLARKFDAIERRLAALEVSHEAMRDDIRALADAQAVTNARLDRLEACVDRFESETRGRFDALEARMDRLESETRGPFDALEVRFDRFQVDFGTVVLDHGRRIRTLEEPAES
jgi:predicted  nucleic acid-binding Zn-ribbon protein